MTIVPELYAATREAVVVEVRGLTPPEAAMFVPACPEWTVKDVVAHVCGLVAEALAGVPPPLGSPEATTRQVGDRASMNVGAVCDEWVGYAAAWQRRMEEDPAFASALLADLVVHGDDLVEAGLPIAIDAEATALAAARYVGPLQQRASDLGIALTVDLGGSVSAPPTEGLALTLSAAPRDFLRHVTGRRTRSEVLALDWSGDAASFVDEGWSQYGELSD